MECEFLLRSVMAHRLRPPATFLSTSCPGSTCSAHTATVASTGISVVEDAGPCIANEAFTLVAFMSYPVILSVASSTTSTSCPSGAPSINSSIVSASSGELPDICPLPTRRRPRRSARSVLATSSCRFDMCLSPPPATPCSSLLPRPVVSCACLPLRACVFFSHAASRTRSTCPSASTDVTWSVPVPKPVSMSPAS